MILKTLPSFQIARLTERPSTLDEWARAVLRLDNEIPLMLSETLSRGQMFRLPDNSLILMVGAHGLEPWTR